MRESSNLRIVFKISRECSPSKGGGKSWGGWSFSISNTSSDDNEKSSNSTAGPRKKIKKIVFKKYDIRPIAQLK